MTDQETVMLIETEQRCKSNTHRIDNLENALYVFENAIPRSQDVDESKKLHNQCIAFINNPILRRSGNREPLTGWTTSYDINT